MSLMDIFAWIVFVLLIAIPAVVFIALGMTQQHHCADELNVTLTQGGLP